MSDESMDIADLQARVKNLEGWQKRQNGSIKEVNQKVDRMIATGGSQWNRDKKKVGLRCQKSIAK